MLDNLMFYLIFSIRGAVTIAIIYFLGTTLLIELPFTLEINGNIADFSHAKAPIFYGFSALCFYWFIEMWVDDYKKEYLPHWVSRSL